MVLAARAANELLPRYGNYIWNRLMTVSAEDCAPMVTGEVVALYDAWRKVTKDSSPTSRPALNGHRIFIAKAIVLLAKCKHSRDADELGILVSDRISDDDLDEALADCSAILDDEVPAEHFEIPAWVYDVHTRLGKRAGKTREQFLVDEHEALADASSMFANWRQMATSETYVQPELDL